VAFCFVRDWVIIWAMTPSITPGRMFLRYCTLCPKEAERGSGDTIILKPKMRLLSLNNYLALDAKFGGAVEAVKLKDTLLSMTWGKSKVRLHTFFMEKAVDLMSVAAGKANPDQMERFLSMVEFVIKENPSALKTAFPKILKGGIEGMLNDPERGKNYIGLDCNGFVGNWMIAAGYGPGVSPSSSIGSWPNRGVRKTLDEVQSYDVAALQDNQHIVCLDRVYRDGDKVLADIAQSTGRDGNIGGPQRTLKHPIRATKTKGIFEIGRSEEGKTSVIFTDWRKMRILSAGFDAK
jgi:hypothetical protein